MGVPFVLRPPKLRRHQNSELGKARRHAGIDSGSTRRASAPARRRPARARRPRTARGCRSSHHAGPNGSNSRRARCSGESLSSASTGTRGGASGLAGLFAGFLADFLQVSCGHWASSFRWLVAASRSWTYIPSPSPQGRRKEGLAAGRKGYPVDTKITPPPLCFVLMPFGRKTDATGRTTDFDAVYQQIIAPAVQEAGLEPIRADEEKVGGTIHKPMFERLMLCDYAVADITGANPNVFYELGIRHAMRPRSTVILFAEGTTLPFDIALLRGVPTAPASNGAPLDAPSCAARVARQLDAARRNPHRRQPVIPAARIHAAIRGRSQQDRHLSRPVRLFEEIQGPPCRRPRAGAGAVNDGDGRAGARQPARGRGRHRRRPVSLAARRQDPTPP